LSSILIVSGCPGCGKTTLSAALADSLPEGLHIPSDSFYEFPAHAIDPTRPESRHQNTVVMRALARTARAFAEGGYDVVLDGIFGPWFLPVLGEELRDGPEVSYVVLRVDEDEALRRVREREGPGATGAVRHMVAAFAELGDYQAHAVETLGRSPGSVLESVREGLRAGSFRLSW